MSASAQVTAVLVATWLMVLAGLSKRRLRLREKPRRWWPLRHHVR